MTDKETMKKKAQLLLAGGSKFMQAMGFEKEAQDPVKVYKFLVKLRDREHILHKQAKAIVQLEKTAQDPATPAGDAADTGWWDKIKKALTEFGTQQLGIKDPRSLSGLYGGLAGLGLGALGGGLMGRDWRSALAGALAGGAAGGYGGYQWPFLKASELQQAVMQKQAELMWLNHQLAIANANGNK